jgi:3-phosphoglycerate kinase
MKNLAFGMAKSEIQSSLTNSYNQIMNAANEAMGLPVDQQTAKKLEESEIGRQYLQVLRDFTTRLESGSREVGQLKNVFKGSKT